MVFMYGGSSPYCAAMVRTACHVVLWMEKREQTVGWVSIGSYTQRTQSFPLLSLYLGGVLYFTKDRQPVPSLGFSITYSKHSQLF